MKRRTYVTAIVLAAVLSVGCAEMLIVAEAVGLDGGAPVTAEAPQKKKGKSFVGVLSAPFRALGKLFGGGRTRKTDTADKKTPEKNDAKNDPKEDNKLYRVTAKDAASFKGAMTVRVSNGVTIPDPVLAGAAESAPHVLVAEARTMIARRDYGEAINLLSRATSSSPDLAEAFHLLGYAYDRKGLRHLSFNSYKRALKLAPNDSQLLNDYGYSLFLHGDHDDAKDLLKRAAKFAPGDERIWNNLAVVQFKLGKFDDAFKSFARAGGEFKGRMNIGNMLERAGWDKEALKHYEVAQKLDPMSIRVLQHLGEVYQRLGRKEEAEVARQALNNLKRDTAKTVNGGM